MTETLNEAAPSVHWKVFLTTALESWLAFYLATFCMALYFTHQGFSHLLPTMLMIVLYLFVIGVCGYRVLTKLSMATIMLTIPIAPLIALFSALSLIPVLQFF